MYYNKYLLAKIGFDTAENEPREVWITDFTHHRRRSHAAVVRLTLKIFV